MATYDAHEMLEIGDLIDGLLDPHNEGQHSAGSSWAEEASSAGDGSQASSPQRLEGTQSNAAAASTAPCWGAAPCWGRYRCGAAGVRGGGSAGCAAPSRCGARRTSAAGRSAARGAAGGSRRRPSERARRRRRRTRHLQRRHPCRCSCTGGSRCCYGATVVLIRGLYHHLVPVLGSKVRLGQECQTQRQSPPQ